MRTKQISIFLLISLIGLAVIQFRLVFLGVKAEKQKFDERVRIGLQETKNYLEQHHPLADSLVEIMPFFPQEIMREKPETTDFVLEGLKDYLKNKFAEKGIYAQFSFAITDYLGKKVVLKSPNFEAGSFAFDYYGIGLGDRIIARCHCQRTLHVDIHNIFGVLLWQLNFLLLPSILFLLTLVACFWAMNRLLAKERKLNITKNEFINNLTHELKTPVFSVSLSAKMLKTQLETGDLEKAKQFLTLIDNENQRMKVQVEKVLELAALESGNYRLYKQQTDISILIDSVTAAFQLKVNNLNGTFSKSLIPTAVFLNIDATHIKNVLQNLLENALKYSHEIVDIQLNTAIHDGIFFIEIRDSGIGIAQNEQQKIFDKFYRIGSGDLHQVKGFGLGLSYVKSIIDAHDFTISVESQLGEGSTFIIKAPL